MGGLLERFLLNLQVLCASSVYINILVKFQILKVFGAVNPNSWAYQGEIWHVGAQCQILPWWLQVATCHPCGAKNLKISQWVKTIPAELPCGQILPVMTWLYSVMILRSCARPENENDNGSGNSPMMMHLLLQATAHGATACNLHSSFPLGTLETFASALYTDCSCIERHDINIVNITAVQVSD